MLIKMQKSNDASIVLKATYNKVSFLLMSDADKAIEDEINSKYDVKATMLKNGHHGSDTSSSATYINNVKPSVAILSYGKNNSYRPQI
jgi:competence protein ComEC